VPAAGATSAATPPAPRARLCTRTYVKRRHIAGLAVRVEKSCPDVYILKQGYMLYAIHAASESSRQCPHSRERGTVCPPV